MISVSAAEADGAGEDRQEGLTMNGDVLELLGPSAGGIRRHVDVLASHLDAVGWAPVVAGPAGVMDGLDAASSALTVPVGTRPDRAVRAVAALRRLAPSVDVIHAHGLSAGWLAVLARTGRPVVLTVHNVVLDEAAGRSAPLLRRLERSLPSRVDHVIAVSAEIARHLPSTATPVSVVIPASPAPSPVRTPQEIRTALGIDRSRPLVVSVGRLHPQKAIGDLLLAAVELRARVPGAVVAVVGDGPSRGELEARAVGLDLGDTVRFLGAQPDGASWLAAADVVALSSIWEGSPLVVAEALQLGRPLVATDVGDVGEVVQDGRTGHLVAPSAPTELADGLVSMLTDRGAARRMGQAGQELAAVRYGASTLVQAVAHIYDEVHQEPTR